MKIDKLKELIAYFEDKKKRKRGTYDTTLFKFPVQTDSRVDVLKAYLAQYTGEIFYFKDFYDYCVKKHTTKWTSIKFSEDALRKDTSDMGELFRRLLFFRIEKLPKLLRTEVIYTYLNASNLANMSCVSLSMSKEIKVSRHYKYWKDTYSWKEKIIKLGCKKEPLNIIFNTTHIKNYKYLFNVLEIFPPHILLYTVPWPFYLMSGEIHAIEHAISFYQLTDIIRSDYFESPFFVALLSGNYRAAHFVFKQTNAQELKPGSFTPLEYAAWSHSATQVEYIRCFLRFLPEKSPFFYSGEQDNIQSALQYAHRIPEVIDALSKPFSKIDQTQFVDEDNKPIFKMK